MSEPDTIIDVRIITAMEKIMRNIERRQEAESDPLVRIAMLGIEQALRETMIEMARSITGGK